MVKLRILRCRDNFGLPGMPNVIQEFFSKSEARGSKREGTVMMVACQSHPNYEQFKAHVLV